MQVNKTCNSN